MSPKASTPSPPAARSPEASAWSHPGPAAFDLRSDVVTTPTTAMLAAIQSTTLLDDVFSEDPTTLSLEQRVATLTGHASALLVLSGTMGNQIALKTHLTGPPQGVLCDARAHVWLYEAGGVSSLSNALLQPVAPTNGKFLTLEDVREAVVLDEDVHGCPTRVVSLENTLNGVIMPLAEARRISAWARGKGLKVHLDGARLWEAVAAGAGGLEEYCACFDSVSLCFSKGLGAPIGSVVVGGTEFVKRARWIRKMLGGGLRQAGVISAAARVAVEDTFLGGKLRRSHANARRVARLWEELGGKMKYPADTNMSWLDLESAGIRAEQFIELGKKHGLKCSGGRLVVHYQIGEEAIQRLQRLFLEILGNKSKL